MRKRPLILVACVFLTGLAYQRYPYKSIAAIVAVFILREIWIGRKKKKLLKAAGRSILLLSAFLIGVLHMKSEESFRKAYMSKIVDGSRITVWGEYIKTETTEYGNRGFLSDCYLDFGEGIIPCNDIVVYTSNNHFRVGQIHKINGKVNMFSQARNEGNFDAFVYYQSLKIDFALDEESSILLGETENVWERFLFSLRSRISQVYDWTFEEKTAGFYQAMVLGEKTNLDESLKDLFLIGGISHILAISGLHVSILGRGFYGILRRMGIGFGIAGSLGSILLLSYCVMVGSSASTVRAVGMMLFFFLGQWLGRSYDMLNALGGMVLFLLWNNPFLIENSGFWFSFTALLGVGYVGKELSQGIEMGKKKKHMDFSGLWMSLGITLTGLPVTALSYYEIPIYSPLVNFVVLPLLTPVFCLAIIGGVLGLYAPEVSTVILQPCRWLLTFYEWICSIVETLPYSGIICGKPDLGQVILYYGILFGGIYVLSGLRKANSEKRKLSYGIMRTGIIIACVVGMFFPKSHPFEITFLDVGQGDGIYISAGDGTTYFIDGGSTSVNEVGEYRILPFLKAKGVREIDYWFVSHTDLDHVSGLLEIIENRYKIEHIVLYELCSMDDLTKTLIEIADKNEIEVLLMKKGERVKSKDMIITCIGPIESVTEDKNENSLVLQLEWYRPKNFFQSAEQNEFTALFAGDISSDMEEKLYNAGVLSDVDLFKANHHGSNYSNCDIFLAELSPEYIVVSCSEKNLYGHPGVHAVKRMEDCGAEVFYTMENGQITFPLIQ